MFYLEVQKKKKSIEKTFETNKERSAYILDNWDNKADFWCSNDGINWMEVRDFPWLIEA